MKVFLLDDHEMIRRGMCELFEDEPDIEVVGQSASAQEAIRRIPALRPDVAVLDARLPDGSGIDVCREVRSRTPGLNVLILTSFDDEDALWFFSDRTNFWSLYRKRPHEEAQLAVDVGSDIAGPQWVFGSSRFAPLVDGRVAFAYGREGADRLAVLEAAQRGSALVLSDIPTFRELWDNAAVFVPPRDPDAIAAAIRRLFAEPERRARLGQAARERAGRYGVDAMVDGMLRVYRPVATTGGSREAAA